VRRHARHARRTQSCSARAGQAPLADPYATPDEARISELDVLLRHVAHALVDGADAAADGLKYDADGLRANAKARSFSYADAGSSCLTSLFSMLADIMPDRRCNN